MALTPTILYDPPQLTKRIVRLENGDILDSVDPNDDCEICEEIVKKNQDPFWTSDSTRVLSCISETRRLEINRPRPVPRYSYVRKISLDNNKVARTNLSWSYCHPPDRKCQWSSSTSPLQYQLLYRWHKTRTSHSDRPMQVIDSLEQPTLSAWLCLNSTAFPTRLVIAWWRRRKSSMSQSGTSVSIS